MENEIEIGARVDKVVQTEGKLKAFCTLTIAGQYSVHGVRIIESEKGLFVAMPSEKYTDKDGKEQYREIFHPVTAEARTAMTQAALAAYESATSQEP